MPQFSWSFQREDLKQAVLSLLFNDDLKSDMQVATIVHLIKVEFDDDYEMFDWTKDILEKVKNGNLLIGPLNFEYLVWKIFASELKGSPIFEK